MPSLRLALRQFARQRAFTVTAVLVLAIGMGANVAVFSLVHTFHFTPLPVRDPDQLVAVLVPETGNLFTEEGYRVLGGHTNALSEFAAFARASLIVRRGDQPSRQSIEYVTPNYFEFLGIHAAMGRSLSVADRNTPHLVRADWLWAGHRHVTVCAPSALRRRPCGSTDVCGCRRGARHRGGTCLLAAGAQGGEC